MSKLEEIIRLHSISCFKEINVDKDEKVIRDIKALMLELVGRYQSTEGSISPTDKAVNEFKAKLRQKVNEL